MDAIIYGCGPLASSLVHHLVAREYLVTVVGDDLESLKHFSGIENTSTVLVVDAAMQDYLQEANVALAELFVAISGNDLANVLVSQAASHLFNVPSVICRIDDPDLRQMYAGLGIHTLGLSDLDLLSDLTAAVDQ